jgi:chaperonin cofactor prefoldin
MDSRSRKAANLQGELAALEDQRQTLKTAISDELADKSETLEKISKDRSRVRKEARRLQGETLHTPARSMQRSRKRQAHVPMPEAKGSSVPKDESQAGFATSAAS